MILLWNFTLGNNVVIDISFWIVINGTLLNGRSICNHIISMVYIPWPVKSQALKKKISPVAFACGLNLKQNLWDYWMNRKYTEETLKTFSLDADTKKKCGIISFKFFVENKHVGYKGICSTF